MEKIRQLESARMKHLKHDYEREMSKLKKYVEIQECSIIIKSRDERIEFMFE